MHRDGRGRRGGREGEERGQMSFEPGPFSRQRRKKEDQTHPTTSSSPLSRRKAASAAGINQGFFIGAIYIYISTHTDSGGGMTGRGRRRDEILDPDCLLGREGGRWVDSTGAVVRSCTATPFRSSRVNAISDPVLLFKNENKLYLALRVTVNL